MIQFVTSCDLYRFSLLLLGSSRLPAKEISSEIFNKYGLGWGGNLCYQIDHATIHTWPCGIPHQIQPIYVKDHDSYISLTSLGLLRVGRDGMLRLTCQVGPTQSMLTQCSAVLRVFGLSILSNCHTSKHATDVERQAQPGQCL